MPNIKIVIPQNQGPTRYLLSSAGWEPVFEHGHPEEEEEQGQILNKGIIRETGDRIIQVRSIDALRLVASGRYDVGLVGSDCLLEKPFWGVEKLSEFSFGRAWGLQPPRLEIVIADSSKVRTLKDARPGAIFFTERPRITSQFLTNIGLDVELENDEENLLLFRERLEQEKKVGIWEILGSVPVQLENKNDFGVMVNESGRTLRDYGMRVIAKIMDVKTVLIANSDSLYDESKKENILRLREDLEGTYRRIEKEMPHGIECEGRLNPSEGEESPENQKGLGRRL